MIINEAFVRGFLRRGGGSPIGARLRYSNRSGASATDSWFEIVGVVRDLGLDPDDEGNESAYVFHAASAATVSPLVMSVGVRGNPATLVARLPTIAADVDAGLYVREARPLSEWIRRRDLSVITSVGALALAGILGHAMVLMGSGITAGGVLVLLFVALGGGPTGRPGDDVVKFAVWLGATSAVMLAACLFACIEPARRALRINPIDALREA